jgi:CBS domain-containing protein
VLGYLAWINFIVAGFNMLPAFPLDGGRVLRAALWGIKKDVRWATRIAAGLGGGLGLLLAVFGLYRVFRWDFIGGLWFFLIGMFLRQAAQASYERLLIRKLFAGETVRSFMRQNPISVSPLLSVQELVEDYFYRYHFKLFPVVSDGRLVGCVHLESLRELPKSSWAEARVEQLAGPCSPQNTIAPDTDLIAALSLLNRTQSSMLMVVERQRLVGIITLKDIMNFLAIKMALQEIEAPPHKTGGTSVGDVSRIHGSPDRVLAGTQA